MDYRVFLVDCDGVITLADEDSHAQYFSDIGKTFRSLRLMYKVGHLLDKSDDPDAICDFKGWIVATPRGIIACTKNLTYEVYPDLWRRYLENDWSSVVYSREG